MKTQLKLTQTLLDKHGFDVKIDEIEEPIVKRLTTRGELSIGKDEESTVVGSISTIGVDIDKDIVLPEGIDLSRYEKNPVVLYQHSMSNPIGKAVKIKVTEEGILAKTVFASTAFAQDIFTLIKEGILNTFSIGFIPLKVLYKGTNEYEEKAKVLRKAGRIEKKQLDEAERIIEKALLFEYSIVSVPANEDALIEAVSTKSLSDETYEALHIEKPAEEEVQEENVEEEVQEKPVEEVKEIEVEVEEQEETKEEEPQETGIKIIGRVDDIKVLGKSAQKKECFKIIGKDASDKVSLAYRLLKGKIS